MAISIGEVLTRQQSASFCGRSRELDVMRRLLGDDAPLVLHISGVSGIGKTRLLAQFAAEAGALGAAVVQLDCRAVEPTERGFVHELAAATGAPELTLAAVVARLGSLGGRVVLALDGYESFRLLDGWLRQALIPALDAHVRVVLAGREPAAAAWSLAPEWHGLFRALVLEGLEEADALAMLQRAGLSHADARRINRLARGHPLALRLASTAALQRATVDIEADTMPQVLAALTDMYLADTRDPLARQALQAASVVRRATLSLLHAMLPALPAREAYERLAALPFVEARRDGLRIHDIVHQAVAAELRSADPASHRAYRHAAWEQLRAEAQGAGRADLWRYTADMLYLLEAPQVREVFFPSGTTPFAVEPARPEDLAAVRTVGARHDGPEAAALLDHWWRSRPDSFVVVRDRDNDVVGFSCLLRRSALRRADVQRDPAARAWWEHLGREPLEPGEDALLLRLCMAHESGRRSSAELSALVLDLKRTYMELRPQLRRIYTLVDDMPAWEAFLQRAGFRALAGAAVVIDGAAFQLMLLDFGPASVDGWLANLVAAELKPAGEPPVSLDVEGHELLVDGQRVALTRLELAVLRYLIERAGKAVPRGDLLEDVWGYSYDGGSNVVDVIVRSLRKKLGVRAYVLETVTKVGYRFRQS